MPNGSFHRHYLLFNWIIFSQNLYPSLGGISLHFLNNFYELFFFVLLVKVSICVDGHFHSRNVKIQFRIVKFHNNNEIQLIWVLPTAFNLVERFSAHHFNYNRCFVVSLYYFTNMYRIVEKVSYNRTELAVLEVS